MSIRDIMDSDSAEMVGTANAAADKVTTASDESYIDKLKSFERVFGGKHSPQGNEGENWNRDEAARESESN